MSRIIVTCGPSFEPIDEVRRITNSSSGELGVRLANRLSAAGFEVVCVQGEMASVRGPFDAARVVPFSTNDDLLAKLETLSHQGETHAVLHAAALADFKVHRDGAERKISSRSGEIALTLVPATKILPRLRSLFPQARIVGWKYELDGSREEALAKGRAQIAECATDACAVNGAAYGDGFGFLTRDGAQTHLPDKSALADFLATWLASKA
jgi:phosphopantothenoylcysteine synthetase/decarboxylase